jgi:hypothetical protein
MFYFRPQLSCATTEADSDMHTPPLDNGQGALWTQSTIWDGNIDHKFFSPSRIPAIIELVQKTWFRRTMVEKGKREMRARTYPNDQVEYKREAPDNTIHWQDSPPLDSSIVGDRRSQPIDIPIPKHPRPTLMKLPEHLLLKKRTPFEKAGMCWYRN